MTRTSILGWHRRIALLFAPLLVVQAITGGLLLAIGPWDSRADAPAIARTQEAISIYRANAEAAVEGFRTTRLYLPDRNRPAGLAILENSAGVTRYASFATGSTEVISAGPLIQFPVEFVRQLHYRLLDGRVGLAIVCANGLALLALSITGLFNWWPKPGTIVASLKVRSGLPLRFALRQWHRTAGAIASLALLFSAITGVLLAYPGVIAGGSAPAQLAKPDYDEAQLNAAVARAAREFPGATMRDIRFRPNSTIAINFHAPDRNPRAVHTVVADPVSGQIGSTLAANDNDALWVLVLPLHTGETFGLIGKVLLLIGASALALLGISGPYAWWLMRRRKSRKTKR